MTNQKPVHEVRLGGIRAAIRRNEREGGLVTHSVGFSRLDKDDGGWRDATSFGRGELPLVACVAEMARDWIHAQPGGENPQADDE